MKRMPMIAGNWKMNTNIDEAVKLVKAMLPGLDKLKGVEKVVCPPFISLDGGKRIYQRKLGQAGGAECCSTKRKALIPAKFPR